MMESREPDGQAPAEGDALDDLRVTALDGGGPGERRMGKRWRWGLRLSGVAALLGLVALAAVTLSPLLAPLLPRLPTPRAAETQPLDSTALQIPPEARSCFAGAAWSPDSAQVAIVRDSACDSSSALGRTTPTALIFDGATGRLRNWFPLDATILQNAHATDQVELGGVAWTPDGQQIAVPFTVFPMSGPGAATFGLALLSVRGAHIGDFVDWSDTAPSLTPSDPLTHPGPRSVTVWDVQQSGYRALSVAPAYAYRWQADGSLDPAALPGAPAGTGTPGGAIMGAGFSLWRHGQVWLVDSLNCAGRPVKFLSRPYIALRLSTLAWSPDGRYLTQVSAAGRYAAPGEASSAATPTPPSPFASCSAGPEPNLLPLAPAHDAGLRVALALASPGVVLVDLEWRPDGKRLAALTFNPGGTGSAIVLYDCRTGAVIHRYTARQFPITGLPGTGPAKNFNQVFTSGAWSPDGKWLLVEAVGTGAVPFILGPGALGV